jgi:hypothetical protein
MTGADEGLVPRLVSEEVAFPSMALPGLMGCEDKSSGFAAKSQRSGNECWGEWASVFWSGTACLSNGAATDDASDASADVCEGFFDFAVPSPETGVVDATR